MHQWVSSSDNKATERLHLAKAVGVVWWNKRINISDCRGIEGADPWQIQALVGRCICCHRASTTNNINCFNWEGSIAILHSFVKAIYPEKLGTLAFDSNKRRHLVQNFKKTIHRLEGIANFLLYANDVATYENERGTWFCLEEHEISE